MAFTESFETINGCKTRFMRGGKGAPLLFLHGGGGAGAWLPFMEKLSERFEMIVPEHPGFGGSDSPDWLDNIGDVAFFYLDMIEKFGLKGINLVGTSLGGWISCEIAVRDNSALNRLVLVAPAGIHVKGIAKGDTFMWSPEQTMRNLFHDQKIAEAVAGAPAVGRRAARRHEKPAGHGEARLAAAALQSASLQVAASHRDPDPDHLGR